MLEEFHLRTARLNHNLLEILPVVDRIFHLGQEPSTETIPDFSQASLLQLVSHYFRGDFHLPSMLLRGGSQRAPFVNLPLVNMISTGTKYHVHLLRTSVGFLFQGLL